jgi:hypothetical protein
LDDDDDYDDVRRNLKYGIKGNGDDDGEVGVGMEGKSTRTNK